VAAAKGTRDRMLAEARAEVGTVESPRGSNRTEFAAVAGHPNGLAWCATFLVALARRAGVTLPGSSAYTPTLEASFRRAGRFGSRPAVGAFVFYRWRVAGVLRTAHVGIVEAVNRDGSIVAIEGNTDSAGGRTGGRVMRHVRRANIVGYGYPAYAAAPKPSAPPPRTQRATIRPGDKGAGVRELQARLVQRGHRIAVDGSYGPASQHAVRRVQAKYGLAQDAIVGPRTWEALYR